MKNFVVKRDHVKMNNTFELKFNKADTGIAGYSFGKKIFKQQAEDNIDYSKEITIIFPENIKIVASSFVQGFFDVIVQNIGLRGVEEKVIIRSSSIRLSEKIKNNIR